MIPSPLRASLFSFFLAATFSPRVMSFQLEAWETFWQRFDSSYTHSSGCASVTPVLKLHVRNYHHFCVGLASAPICPRAASDPPTRWPARRHLTEFVAVCSTGTNLAQLQVHSEVRVFPHLDLFFFFQLLTTIRLLALDYIFFFSSFHPSTSTKGVELGSIPPSQP